MAVMISSSGWLYKLTFHKRRNNAGQIIMLNVVAMDVEMAIDKARNHSGMLSDAIVTDVEQISIVEVV